MSPHTALNQIVRVVSDGTGRSPEEVELLVAATVAVALSVAAAHAIAWAVDLVTDLPVRPPHSP